jgi:hypothetical protein
MLNVLEEIEVADQLGLDVFALGEHHRPDYLISAPTVVLGAAAVKTKKIRLSSAVTVLSSDDPIRVFQQFAEIDLLSAGLAEIMAGRGSFIESFPLFGYKLDDYDELFSEKLEMLLELNKSEIFSWRGKHTQTINKRGVYPRPYQRKYRFDRCGGTPESVVRAAEHGLPMALAIIGDSRTLLSLCSPLPRCVCTQRQLTILPNALSNNSHTYIADDAQARDEFYTPYSDVMNRIGRERASGYREHLMRQPGCKEHCW